MRPARSHLAGVHIGPCALWSAQHGPGLDRPTRLMVGLERWSRPSEPARHLRRLNSAAFGQSAKWLTPSWLTGMTFPFAILTIQIS